MRDRKWPADSNTYEMIHDVVTGLRYLHELEPPVVHGSLNAGKIYVTDSNTVKLGEFGLAMLTQAFATLVPTVSYSEICRYMSPERLNNGDEMVATIASDVWALGCTLYEVLSTRLPYSTYNHDVEVAYMIKSGVKPGNQGELQISDLFYLWSVIEDCWSTSPEERPPSYEVLTKILTLKQRVQTEPSHASHAEVVIDTNAPYVEQLQVLVQNLEFELSYDYTSTRSSGRPIWTATPIGTGATKVATQADAARRAIISGEL
ncbi:hypothetical protein FRC07_012077 [Ceratobasidium sp. 392]|nr:hypothetical protein FRC07_012077 [Ceratobasidium sp. 392]